MMKFDDLPISPEVKKAIHDLGFGETFPIQERAIPPMIEGRNVIGQAKTGTGKTAAFGVPMIMKVDPESREVQGLVIAPTRELAVQITDDVNAYAKYTPVRAICIYGGVSIEGQMQELRKGAQIVVGTPGRLIDHMKRGTLTLKRVRSVVLDEADRILDMGFIEDIEWILRRTPEEKQVSLWSATIDDRTMRLSKSYMPDAELILVSRDEIALETIDQKYIIVAPYEKTEILERLIDYYDIDRCIVFCRMRITVDRLTEELKRAGYDAESIHGQLSQARREQVLEEFREGRIRLMIATEVAARGLDIVDVPYIINYDVPDDPLMYFHRIGRTARAGKRGNAITLVTFDQAEELEQIKALTGTEIEKISLPPAFLF